MKLPVINPNITGSVTRLIGYAARRAAFGMANAGLPESIRRLLEPPAR